jgi:hypothetical protein
MSTRPRRSTRSTANTSRQEQPPPDPEDSPAPSSPNSSADSEKVAPLKIKLSKRKRKRGSDEGRHLNFILFNSALFSDSDEEFERLLEQRDQQLDDEERKREKSRDDRRTSKKKKEAEKKSALQMDHQDYCEVCQQGGEVILCDGCPKAYHQVCLEPELEEVPEGIWLCQTCVENGVTVNESAINDELADGTPQNMDTCVVCKEGGFLICCDTCPFSYHAYCLTPPLEDLPPEDEEWSCPHCTCEEPPHKPQKIISWRWKIIPYPDPVAIEDLPKEGEKEEDIDSERHKRLMLRPPRQMEPRRTRELFVKVS